MARGNGIETPQRTTDIEKIDQTKPSNTGTRNGNGIRTIRGTKRERDVPGNSKNGPTSGRNCHPRVKNCPWLAYDFVLLGMFHVVRLRLAGRRWMYRVLSSNIKSCGPFWKEVQISRIHHQRRALLIAGMLHVWESNPSARAETS